MRPAGLASRPVARLLVAVAAALAVVGGGSRPVAAHTDVEFTLPTDGASVGVPLDEITVGFTEPVTLIGPGFEVLDPAGDVLTPFVVTDDDRVFRLQLDPPLAGGEAAVRFEVRAGDGHTLTGGFAFTVTAEPPTTVAVSTTSPVTSAATTPTAPPTDPSLPATSSTEAAGSDATSPPATDPVPASNAPTGGPDGAGSSTGAYVGIGVLVALAAATLLVLRARSSPSR